MPAVPPVEEDGAMEERLNLDNRPWYDEDESGWTSPPVDVDVPKLWPLPAKEAKSVFPVVVVTPPRFIDVRVGTMKDD